MRRDEVIQVRNLFQTAIDAEKSQESLFRVFIGIFIAILLGLIIAIIYGIIIK